MGCSFIPVSITPTGQFFLSLDTREGLRAVPRPALGSPQSAEAAVFAVHQDWKSDSVASMRAAGLGEQARPPH